MRQIQTVLIVADHALVNGGQAKVAIESAIGLAGRGLDVRFFSAVGPPDPRLEAAGVKVKCLGQQDILSEPNRVKAMVNGLWNRRAASELKHEIRRLDRDSSVVHLHGWAKALSPSISPVLSRCGIPVVYTLHEYFNACPNGGFYDYQEGTICQKKAMSLACLVKHCDARAYSHKIWRVIRQAVFILSGFRRNINNYIYISKRSRSVMQAYLNSDSKLYFVANPIDVKRQQRVPAEDNDIYLYIGRLSPEKGALEFAHAASEAGVKAVFVGDGQLKEKVLELCPEAVVTGWVLSQEVIEWLKRARVLVFPSKWYETQGMVTLEAKAMGIPVIVGKHSAAIDGVVDQRTGVLFDFDGNPDLVSAIRECFNDDKVMKMGLQAYEAYWGSPSSLEHHVDALLACYENLS